MTRLGEDLQLLMNHRYCLHPLHKTMWTVTRTGAVHAHKGLFVEAPRPTMWWKHKPKENGNGKDTTS